MLADKQWKEENEEMSCSNTHITKNKKKDNVLKSIETRCVRPTACKGDSLRVPCGEKMFWLSRKLKKKKKNLRF